MKEETTSEKLVKLEEQELKNLEIKNYTFKRLPTVRDNTLVSREHLNKKEETPTEYLIEEAQLDILKQRNMERMKEVQELSAMARLKAEKTAADRPNFNSDDKDFFKDQLIWGMDEHEKGKDPLSELYKQLDKSIITGGLGTNTVTNNPDKIDQKKPSHYFKHYFSDDLIEVPVEKSIGIMVDNHDPYPSNIEIASKLKKDKNTFAKLSSTIYKAKDPSDKPLRGVGYVPSFAKMLQVHVHK